MAIHGDCFVADLPFVMLSWQPPDLPGNPLNCCELTKSHACQAACLSWAWEACQVTPATLIEWVTGPQQLSDAADLMYNHWLFIVTGLYCRWSV